MGDIADMYIEAEMAGLDPTEMDGHDWAEFYSEPVSKIEHVRWDARDLYEGLPQFHDEIFKDIPEAEVQTFLKVLEQIGGTTNG